VRRYENPNPAAGSRSVAPVEGRTERSGFGAKRGFEAVGDEGEAAGDRDELRFGEGEEGDDLLDGKSSPEVRWEDTADPPSFGREEEEIG